MNREAWTDLENPVGFEELTFGGLRLPEEEQVCLKVSFSKQAGTNEPQDEVLTLVLSHDNLGELIDLLERGTRWLNETLPDTPFSEIVWYG